MDLTPVTSATDNITNVNIINNGNVHVHAFCNMPRREEHDAAKIMSLAYLVQTRLRKIMFAKKLF